MMILDEALKYAAQGWPVFPVNEKIPLIKEWPAKATTDEAQITAWWEEYPKANIGLVTGKRSGLLVLDVDGPMGEASLEALMQEHGNLPQTLTAATGRGWHIYFRYPNQQDIKNDVGKKLGQGLDVRGMGGFVVAPGSRHANGSFYAWIDTDAPLANPPGWLLELLEHDSTDKQEIALAPIPITTHKATHYGESALSQACNLVAQAANGTRNDTLNTQAYSIGQLVGSDALTYYEAETRLMDAAQSAGLSRREALATVKSGLASGQKQPRDLSNVGQSTVKSAPAKSRAGKTAESVPAMALKSISALELMNKEFKAPRWAIPGLLPEGLTILAGRPKSGKSWLAFDMCIAVASGGMALGNRPVQQGEALYLALEDSERRLQDRLLQLVQDESAPDGLLFTTEAPRYDQGGLRALEDWLDNHPACRLVVLDTLGRFRPAGKSAEGYAEETYLLGCLQRLALDKGIALVVIHHTRKANADNHGGDPLDDVLGSTGLTGVADSIWVLKRPRTETVAQLFMTSRDVGEQVQTIEFDSERCRWHLQVESETQARSVERQKILDCLAMADTPKGPKEVATETGLPYDSVRHLLRHMEAEGSVCRKARGKYLVEPPP
ncbi:MAG: hypothetical protein K0Q50_1161 [Vampirovibrio sp.]|jgi:RecA-family ATPase|nr:hypothetical protein [Vampirovibrio sp.]